MARREPVAEEMLLGKLTWKGTFGFIKCSTGEEFFCSERDFLKSGQSADTGDAVEFVASGNTTGGRNRRAVRISSSQEALTTVVERGLDGHIVKLNWDGGFGFIRPKVSGKDVYFKISDGTDLRIGGSVVYSLQDDLGRASAVDVTCLGISKPVKPLPARTVPARALRFGPRDRDMSGLVVSFKPDKYVDDNGVEIESGFGFIRPDGEEDTIFVHSDESGILKRGVRVSFNVIETTKGRKAVNVGNVSHLRVPCRNLLCKAGPCHFTDNCPLLCAAKKAAKAADDDADTAATCSTADTNQVPMEPGQRGPNDRRQMRQMRRQRC
jgi:cold shock CspA family protein